MTFILSTQRACAATTSVRPDLRRRRAQRPWWRSGRDFLPSSEARNRRALAVRSWSLAPRDAPQKRWV